MATKLFVNVAAASIGSALVRSVSDMTPVAFPSLVIGDGRSYELYFVDGLGGYASFSGSGAYIPYIAIGECGYPSGGTAIWTFNGQSTAALSYNISPAALQTALQALSSIGSGNCTVAGVAGKYYVVTFTGALAAAPQPEITVNFAGLTPASTVSITTITAGSASPATNAVQLAALAENPLTFADNWALITNGWTGQLSTRTLEMIEAFAAGGNSLSETFQITVADPVGVRTTYLKVAASIACTIIDPESFAGADKPLLATQAALNAAVLGLNNFTREDLASSATGNTNITRATTSRHHTAVIAITGAAGTRTLSVLTTNAPSPGDTVLLVLQPDTTPGLILEVRNATAGGTLLNSITTDASGRPYLVMLNWTGSTWQLDFSDGTIMRTDQNLAGLTNPLTAKANLKTLFSNRSAKTASFTVVAPDDDGKFFPISTAGGAVVVTLPSAASAGDGFLIALQKSEASTQVITTVPATLTMPNAGQTMILRSDGTNWVVVGLYDPVTVLPTIIQTVQNRQDITGLVGGTATDLDSIATANGATVQGSALFVSARGGGIWVLRAGTDATSLTVTRPVDFDPTLNPQVWALKMGGFGTAGYNAAALNAGDVTVSPTAPVWTEVYAVGGTARTSKIILGAAQPGWIANIRLAMPATASIFVEIWDSAGVAAIYSAASDDGGGSAFNAFYQLVYNGTAWEKLANASPVV